MDLAQDPETAGRIALHPIETIDHVGLPQRFAQIQRPADQPGALDAQLTPISRLRQGDVTDMELDVEVLVVHPPREVSVERDPHDLASIQRRQMEPLLDERHQTLERHLAARRSRRVIDGQAATAHRGQRRLGIQK
jgi:hypothetical protein